MSDLLNHPTFSIVFHGEPSAILRKRACHVLQEVEPMLVFLEQKGLIAGFPDVRNGITQCLSFSKRDLTRQPKTTGTRKRAASHRKLNCQESLRCMDCAVGQATCLCKQRPEFQAPESLQITATFRNAIWSGRFNNSRTSLYSDKRKKIPFINTFTTPQPFS
jgi:hypothetical protein